MSAADFPARLREFIAQYVRSVIELESLLLLHRQKERQWSASDLARELRVDESYAKQEIADLAQRGLAVCDEQTGLCRYAPREPAIDHAVHELAQIYTERRVSVIEAIYARPTDPIQSFADAFKLRKDKPNG